MLSAEKRSLTLILNSSEKPFSTTAVISTRVVALARTKQQLITSVIIAALGANTVTPVRCSPPYRESRAATWGMGGRDYERVSESVSHSLAHLVNRLLPPSGERFIDVATGTGLTARLLSSRGAKVNGVDFGTGVIEAAKALASDIDFRVADAEALPFEDASFDAVTSTFGVMFVARPEIAAREMARV